MNLRMRQICLVARELEPVVGTLTKVFGLEVAYRDPGVRRYGLENAVVPVGTNFLEVVAPVEGGTAAGRFLERRGGDGGYMVITQCADLEPRRRRCDGIGVRVVNEIDHAGYRELQLHPRDVGAAMLSFAWQDGGDAAEGPWHPAGAGWKSAVRRESVRSLVGAELQAEDPERLARRWGEVLELPVKRDAGGAPILMLDDAQLRFVPAEDGRGEGLAGLDVECADPPRVRAAARAAGLRGDRDSFLIGGVRFYLVL